MCSRAYQCLRFGAAVTCPLAAILLMTTFRTYWLMVRRSTFAASRISWPSSFVQRTRYANRASRFMCNYNSPMVHRMLPNRLPRLRKEYKFTLEQVSQATGLSFSTLHPVEHDERGDMLLGTAFRLAQFYGLSVADIWQPLYDQMCQEVTKTATPSR